MTIKSLKTDHGSSRHDLFYMWPWASLSFLVETTPVKFLKCLWNLSQCVQSIINSHKWLFSLSKWICAHQSNASNNEGFKLPGASSNFNGEKPAKEVFKFLWKQFQWTHNVQKPLARLFRHLIWPKNEEDRPPAIFLLQALLKLVLQIALLCTWTWNTLPMRVITWHRAKPRQRCKP